MKMKVFLVLIVTLVGLVHLQASSSALSVPEESEVEVFRGEHSGLLGDETAKRGGDRQEANPGKQKGDTKGREHGKGNRSREARVDKEGDGIGDSNGMGGRKADRNESLNGEAKRKRKGRGKGRGHGRRNGNGIGRGNRARNRNATCNAEGNENGRVNGKGRRCRKRKRQRNGSGSSTPANASGSVTKSA